MNPSMEWVGYIGVTAFALAWIPQCWDTAKAGRCPVNLGFLLLASLGSFSLAVYAFWRQDVVFSAINTLTTVGALVNVFYRLFPRA
ncbi:MAG: lipid-A-disaccharide synthase N-terminal domain-containing protein [Elusimicrobia bacterium]|nr:lipid-A-disaccharide synthase N-terminal domain-containing protein [Elusimicrobiota bacterium]